MNDYAQLLKARITHLENKQDQEISELKKQANAFIDHHATFNSGGGANQCIKGL